MASYNTVITNEGAALLASVIANQGTLTFSEMRFSTTDYDGVEQTLTVGTFGGVFITAAASGSVVDATTIKVGAQFDNSGIVGDHPLYSIGIVGTDGNTTALIAVCTTTNPDIIRAALTGVSAYAFNVNLSVSSTSNITVTGTTAAVLYDTDVVDNLTSIATNKPLSANQGRVLKVNIDDNFSGQSNENLLDNPFFMVNQRGATNGTANNVYTVDRWIADYGTTAGTWALTASGMTLSPLLNDYVFLKQKIENASELVGKVVTLSVKLSDGTIYSYTFTRAAGVNQNRDFDNGTIRLNFNGLDYVGVVIMRNTNDDPSSRTIKAIKLELGAVSTLANDVAPNYTTELIKCQRYFKVAFNDTWNVGIGVVMATDTIEFYYFSDIPMRVTPSVSTAGAITAIKIADGSEVAISSVEISLDINAKNGRINFKTSTTLAIRDLYILRMNNAKVVLSADL